MVDAPKSAAAPHNIRNMFILIGLKVDCEMIVAHYPRSWMARMIAICKIMINKLMSQALSYS